MNNLIERLREESLYSDKTRLEHPRTDSERARDGDAG